MLGDPVLFRGIGRQQRHHSIQLAWAERTRFSTHSTSNGTDLSGSPWSFQSDRRSPHCLESPRNIGKGEILSVNDNWLYVVFRPVVAQFQPIIEQIGREVKPLLLQIVQYLPNAYFGVACLMSVHAKKVLKPIFPVPAVWYIALLAAVSSASLPHGLFRWCLL